MRLAVPMRTNGKPVAGSQPLHTHTQSETQTEPITYTVTAPRLHTGMVSCEETISISRLNGNQSNDKVTCCFSVQCDAGALERFSRITQGPTSTPEMAHNIA